MFAPRYESLLSPPSICSFLFFFFVAKGLKVNKTVEVQVKKGRFLLEFHRFPSSVKPSLHFSSTVSLLVLFDRSECPEVTVRTFSARFPQLSIQRYDGGPLSSEDLTHPAVIEVTQEMTTMKAEAAILTLPVPKGGKVHFSFRLKEEVLKLFIRVRLRLPQPVTWLPQRGGGLPYYEQIQFLFSAQEKVEG